MRVLMLNNEFPPLGGGTGSVNLALLRRFSRVPGLAIDLITSALGDQREEEQFAPRIRILKVPVKNHNLHHSSNRELLTYAARALPLALALQKAHPYDLCFAWSALPAGALGLALRCLTGLRYLLRVCGPDIPGFERRYQTTCRLLSPLIRASWRGAEVVIAKCAGEADMIRAVDDRVNPALIPNGVDLSTFQPGTPIPDGGPLRLLCVGRLIERKGQHHLIEAVQRLTAEGIDVILELVGTGDAQAALEAQIRELGLRERVRLAGYVPREEIPRYYAAAHVFVLPSFNEGMSVATLEAMGSGLPVVVTRTGGTVELVEEGVNGLTFEWGDVPALVSHLRNLALDRCDVRCMAQASRGRATSFSWSFPAERYLDLFRIMASGMARPEPLVHSEHSLA